MKGSSVSPSLIYRLSLLHQADSYTGLFLSRVFFNFLHRARTSTSTTNDGVSGAKKVSHLSIVSSRIVSSTEVESEDTQTLNNDISNHCVCVCMKNVTKEKIILEGCYGRTLLMTIITRKREKEKHITPDRRRGWERKKTWGKNPLKKSAEHYGLPDGFDYVSVWRTHWSIVPVFSPPVSAWLPALDLG